MTTAVRLAELRSAGLIRSASQPRDVAGDEFLPVLPQLRPLFAGRGLRRGGTVAVAPGSTSLLLALLAEASAAGSWCAVVGLPQLGLVAAAESGIAVEKFALVPYPGPEWPSVVAALLDGVDLVVSAASAGVSAQVASRLAARARQRGSVLISVGVWPGAELTVAVARAQWHGLGSGRGRLRGRDLEVTASGRGAAARTRRVHLQLPAPNLPVDLGLIGVVGDQLTPISPRSTGLGESAGLGKSTEWGVAA